MTVDYTDALHILLVTRSDSWDEFLSPKNSNGADRCKSMVKPPKTMQPEAVNLKKSGRDVQKAFHDDSFHHYMARKIDMQRKQFGLLLPPSPIPDVPAPTYRIASQQSPSRVKTIRFAPETLDHQRSEVSTNKRKKSKKYGVNSVLKRLKKRHGKGRSMSINHEADSRLIEECDHSSTTETVCVASPLSVQPTTRDALVAREHDLSAVHGKMMHRSDLFLTGVVILVNGYTQPDTETLMRMLHKHGGDLERYETSRVTHIIAENLSFAKAKMYKRQRNARPVCKPKWIVDSVLSGKLLPITDFIVEEVKDDSTAGTKSVSSFFQNNGHRDDESPTIKSSAKDANDDTPSNLAGGIYSLGSSCHQDDPIMSDGEGINPSAENLSVEVSATTRCPTDQRYINGKVRTVGTDPNFLESFFAASRLSFIGSFRQRAKPTSKFAPQASLSSDRLVFHIDMDCFFAAVALRNYPEYRDKPVAISHLGEKRGDHVNGAAYVTVDSTSECATCNYPARKFGIKKGMFLGQARALCPSLIILAYDFEGYEEVSDAVSAVLDRYASENAGYVEHVSCDEAYVEFHLPSIDGTSTEGVAAVLAESIRTEIFEETKCTATVGVGKNKLLAKLATDHVKPDRSFVVVNHRDLLKEMNLRDLHGIGHRMGRKLAEEDLLTVQDVWDMGRSGESELCRILGLALGKKIFGFCHGKDDRSIQPAARKTIGAECSYGVRFDGPYGVEHMIEGLCKEVEKRMTHVNARGVKVTVKVKQRKPGAPPPPKFLGHGSCYSHSKSRDTRNGEATRDWASFYEVAVGLFMEMKIAKDEVRGLGITISKLVQDESKEASPDRSTNKGVTNWLSRQPQMVSNSMREDSLPIILDESDVESVVDLSNETEISLPSFDDIALPDLSQIHMSQVDALPIEMRQQILSKMACASRNLAVPTDDGSAVRDARFRQTDVKRMLRLASVKSGVSKVQSEMGNNISVTQLECLPLEMQLQLVNHDLARVGALLPAKKSVRPLANTSNERRPYVSHSSREVKPPDLSLQIGDAAPCETESPTDRSHFFRDNVRPLVAYMDENPDASQDSVAKVVEFLSICVQEQRLVDTAVLLRTVCNRIDAWCNTAFDGIFQAVDDMVQEGYNVRLDKDWVTQA